METERDLALLSVEPARISTESEQPTAQDDSPGQPGKASRTKRSKVACLHCRRRKVRCDVYPHGAPCTNCRLDNIHDCAPCGKKLRRYDVPGHSISSRLPTVQPRPVSIKTGPSVSSSQDSPAATAPSEQVTAAQGQPSTPEGRSKEQSSTPDRQPFNDIFGHQIELPKPQPRPVHENCHVDAIASTPSSSSRLSTVPGFLTCDLSNVSDEDLVYLQNKGCFSFAEKDIIDELLQSYFDYIAPHMPFIDETSFWEMYHAQYHHKGSDESASADLTSISLLLFHAMLFAATTCAPMSLLRRLGYTSRSTARRDAFFRVRALYSLDIEHDSLVLVQAFLLMSYWRGEVGEDKDSWHWVGLAVSLAHHLGLHRKPSAVLTQRQDTVRRRCWWSCVVRDRLVALAHHRRPRIRLTGSDVPQLTLADYNLCLRSGMSGLSPAEELGKRTALTMFSLQLIRLVLCMESDEISTIGNQWPLSPASSETWSRTKHTANDDGLSVGHTGLDDWRLNLPEVLQRSANPDADDSVLPCILVLRNALQIYYHKLILSIVSPRLLLRDGNARSSRDAQLARASSLTLVQLHDELVDRDSVHCIPSMKLDAAALTSFNATAQRTEAQMADFYLWSSLLSGSLACSSSSTWLPSSTDSTGHEPAIQGVSATTFTPPEGDSLFEDTAMLDSFEDLPDFFAGADHSADMLPELASAATDEPKTSTAGGATPGPPTLADYDSFLPVEMAAHEKGKMDDRAFMEQISGSDDKDLALFT